LGWGEGEGVDVGVVVGGRWWSKRTVAVVTGSNKGLGQAIARELARNGVTVVSTARDTARGLAAVDAAVEEEPQLKEFLHFHQLDVTADQSVAELASYLQTTFGGVDILVSFSSLVLSHDKAIVDIFPETCIHGGDAKKLCWFLDFYFF
jgi:NAD(P)-dependent dehydrogenase (short-subunit alcohol dehydrogenase family)